MIDTTIRANERGLGFELEKLDRCLREHIDGIEGSIDIERIHGGQSNPTFFVNYKNRRLVVRKQPGGPVLQSAHAIDREYRVMQALAGSEVPVPQVLFYQSNADVIGTPFYVMARLDGRVFNDGAMPGVTPADRRTMMIGMAETLAKLHKLDWQKLGLSDYGRQGNYFERQFARWTRQWKNSKTRDLPDVEKLIKWLPENIPKADLTCLTHGDFRINNLMFHPTQPKVVALLDWELSTLGHPLADLAYSVLPWRLSPHHPMGLLGHDLKALGIPGEQEYLEYYYSLAPETGKVTPFHTAFAFFRIAVIFEGIAARAKLGNASADNASEVGLLSAELARRGVEAIDGF